MKVLHYEGQEFDLTQWLTIADYCERYGKKPSTVMTWIQRAVVPPDKVVTIPELNGLKLLRDEPYKG
jgi:hypothetical protein